MPDTPAPPPEPTKVPPGGFRTNEEEAAWLASRIRLRTTEMLKSTGINASISDLGLEKLLTLSLRSAERRGSASLDLSMAIASEAERLAIKAVLNEGLTVVGPIRGPAGIRRVISAVIDVIDQRSKPSPAEPRLNWYYAYAEDAEAFHRADNRDDAIAQGTEDYEGEPFFICKARHSPLRDGFFRADRVLEDFENHNDELWGEDGPSCRATPEAMAELEVVLRKAFAAWRARHDAYTPYLLTDFTDCEHITPTAAPEATP